MNKTAQAPGRRAKRKRAPGGGRKPLPADQRPVTITASVSPEAGQKWKALKNKRQWLKARLLES